MKSTEYKVKPLKTFAEIKEVQDTLLKHFKAGRRNYTIFEVGKTTCLRVSDVLALKYDDVYDKFGKVKIRTQIKEQKTQKRRMLYLKPCKKILEEYRDWLAENNFNSQWLFPSVSDLEKPLSRKHFYKIMAKTGDLLGIDYLGTHTMRKTGAYLIYQQTNYDIGFVMQLLNHSSEGTTLHYLGIDQETQEKTLDKIRFE